jgi:hypothetical protein
MSSIAPLLFVFGPSNAGGIPKAWCLDKCHGGDGTISWYLFPPLYL